MFKKSRFRGCFDKKCGKRAQTLLKSASQHLYHIPSSLSRKLCSKKSLFLTCQILGLLVNTLPADEKYLVLNRDNLTIPIQMQLSEKPKILLTFYLIVWSLAEILNVLKKKRTLTAFVFPILRTPKTWLDEKSRLRGSFEKQHGKRTQALFKSASHHLLSDS